jgi:hypothetical protein
LSETLPALATRTPADLIAWGRTAIEAAASFIAAKEIRDQAEALRAYQRSANAAQDVVDAAQEMRIRAERRMGQEIDRAQRDGSAATPHRRQKGSEAPTLSEMGVTKHQSSDWQQLAAVDDETFDATLGAAREEGRLSPTKVRVLLRKRRREAEAAKPTVGKGKRAKAKTARPRGPAWKPPTPEEEERGRATALFQTLMGGHGLYYRIFPSDGEPPDPRRIIEVSAKPLPENQLGHTRFEPEKLRRIADFLTALAKATEDAAP